MEPKEQFLQVWQYLLDNEELDLTDILLLSKIISLHSTDKGCYITNEGICKFLRLKNAPTASRRITKLQKLGYVEVRYVPAPNNPKNTKRYIIPTYENGMILKSSRVDLKVNTPLTPESIPLDSKVNTPLTLESTPPCLESQSIISTYYINNKISEIHQVDNINKLNNEFSVESVEAQIKQIVEKLFLIKDISNPEVNETRCVLEQKKFQLQKELTQLNKKL